MGKKKNKFKQEKADRAKEVRNSKKLKRKNKKNKSKKKAKKEENLPVITDFQDYFDMFYGGEEVEIPHDKFETYKIPSSKEEHAKYLEDMIKESDVLLEVVDARCIQHTRIPEIEQKIKAQNKKSIIIINKVDLVQEEAIQDVISSIKQEGFFLNIILNSSFRRESIQNLLEQIKKTAESIPPKPKIKGQKNNYIKIGLFGYPNVGKTFILNSLKLVDGMDLTQRYMFLNKNKKFGINSIPAIFFAEKEENSILFSKTEKDFDALDDPKQLLEKLFEYVKKDILESKYQIKLENANLEELLEQLKAKYAYDNLNKSAAHLLRDLNSGNVNFLPCKPVVI